MHQANESIYHSIDQQLSEKAKSAIDLLLKQPSTGAPSEWFHAKQEIAQPTLKKTKEFILQFKKLNQLKSMLPIHSNFIPPTKLTAFYHDAEAMDAFMLNQMKTHKRRASKCWGHLSSFF